MLENELNAKGQIAAIGKAKAVAEFSLDGTILAANDHLLRMFDYSFADIKDRHHSIFVEPCLPPPESRCRRIEQVNKAVIQMEGTTQQNAALVEQAAASSESIVGQAAHLAALVARWDVMPPAGRSSPGATRDGNSFRSCGLNVSIFRAK